MEAKGVDTRKLSEAQRATFFQMINTEPSACGKAHSLARSLNEDASCRDSLIVAQFIADRLAAGAAAGDVKDDVQEVLEALKPHKIGIAGRPCNHRRSLGGGGRRSASCGARGSCARRCGSSRWAA